MLIAIIKVDNTKCKHVTYIKYLIVLLSPDRLYYITQGKLISQIFGTRESTPTSGQILDKLYHNFKFFKKELKVDKFTTKWFFFVEKFDLGLPLPPK